jgi:hypothetical protein
MTINNIDTLVQPTMNGLRSLDIDSLSADNLNTDTLNANNMDGNYFSIDVIEADNVRVDRELELSLDGYITIDKGSINEITVTDTEVGYLDGVVSNISKNKSDIVTVFSALDTHSILISNNGNAIDSNLGLISTNITNIAKNTSDIVTVFSALDTHSILISNNGNAIDSNLGLISANTSSINSIKTKTDYMTITDDDMTFSNGVFADFFTSQTGSFYILNSLEITALSIMMNGEQQTHAYTNADHSQLATNTLNISNNAEAIYNNGETITNLGSGMATNSTNIATNTSSINSIKLKTDLMTKHGGNDITFNDGVSATWISANRITIDGETQNHSYIDSDYDAVQDYKYRVIVPTFALSNGWNLVGRTTQFTGGGYYNDEDVIFINQLPELAPYVNSTSPNVWNYGTRTIRVNFSVYFRSYGSALHIFKTQIINYQSSSSSYNTSLYNGI